MSLSSGWSQWIVIAIASGACAAMNGVFAKLTTTELTTSWSHAISSFLGLSPENKLVEFPLRGTFFLLNLLLNALMWALFTRALTLATSTVRVSIINTTANFLLTAFLGAMIFGEVLNLQFGGGAVLLIAGCVIIGAREEGGVGKVGEEVVGGGEGAGLVAGQEGAYRDEDEMGVGKGKGVDEAEDDRVELRTLDEEDMDDDK